MYIVTELQNTLSKTDTVKKRERQIYNYSSKLQYSSFNNL